MTKYFAIKIPSEDKYIALDLNNYLYYRDSDIRNARLFSSEKEAKNCISVAKDQWRSKKIDYDHVRTKIVTVKLEEELVDDKYTG